MLTQIQILFRLSLAVALSGLIGFEREFHGRAAGFRTHILLCIGSTLIMLTSIHIAEIYSGKVPCDPARIAAGVVTGIGFLGAGTIMRSRASVRGLTTAASLWVVSGIGLAVGSGLHTAAIITTVVTLVVLFFFSRLEYSLVRKDWYKILAIETTCGAEQLSRIQKTVLGYDAEMRDFEVEKSEDGAAMILRLTLKLATSKDDDKIISDVSQISGVKGVKWEKV